MEMLLFKLSEFALLKVALGAGALFLGLRLLKKALILILRSEYLRTAFQRNFPAIELLFWFGFLLWGAGVVFQDSFYNFFAVAVISAAFAAWLFWIAGRDWVAGIILRMQDALEVDEILQIGDLGGVVRRLGYLSIDIEADNGDLIKVPYRSITGQIYRNRKKRSRSEMQQMQIEIPAALAADASQTLRQLILNSPWVSVLNEPIIKKIESKEQGDVFEIRAFVYPPADYLTVEEDIKSQLKALHP